MQVWATSVVRDEPDIIGFTLRHLRAQGVDGFVLLDHGSRDGTREAIEQAVVGTTCLLFKGAERAFHQGPMMTELARRALEHGADWIIPFDADELWYSTTKCDLADTLRGHLGGGILRVPLGDHLPTTRDPDKANPFRRMPYRKADAFYATKVALRADQHHTILDGSHGISDDRSSLMPRRSNAGICIRHFPVRGFNHFLNKVRKMAAGLNSTNLPRGAGIQWRALSQLDDEALKIVYYSQYFKLDPEDNGMVYDPAPFKGA